MSNELTIWNTDNKDLVPASAKSVADIADCAVQLKEKDKKQLVAAFEMQHFDMGLTFLWSKTISALKNELATVGVGLIGEMLGKPDVDEDDDIEDILTTRDAIRLAEELGVVTQTDGLRLRQAYELITHFSQLSDSDFDEITEDEAKVSFRSCVKAILARPKVEVAKPFVEFRDTIESKILSKDDAHFEMLMTSPYFFKKLTLSILLNAAKNNTGAQLENSLANINTILPLMWESFRDTERWQTGHVYAELYADGKKTSVAALKSALMKVKGFDYVPENLRSDTFVKAASLILKAHDGTDNFYNEFSPVNTLQKLGSTIPTPALPACMTALLSVQLGNSYGFSWNAAPIATKILKNISIERWQYYLNEALPGDTRVLKKVLFSNPQERWFDLVRAYKLSELQLKNKTVSKLIRASASRKPSLMKIAVNQLLTDFYGANK